MSHTPHTERGAEVIAALMKAPRTVDELGNAIGIEMLTGGAHRCVTNWLRAYQRSGVIRIKGYRRLKTRGTRPAVYELQPSLFALPDATKDVPA